jgi:hypothetical protein
VRYGASQGRNRYQGHRGTEPAGPAGPAAPGGGGCSNRAAADGDVFVEGDVSIVTVRKSQSYSSIADASAADPVKVLC